MIFHQKSFTAPLCLEKQKLVTLSIFLKMSKYLVLTESKKIRCFFFCLYVSFMNKHFSKNVNFFLNHISLMFTISKVQNFLCLRDKTLWAFGAEKYPYIPIVSLFIVVFVTKIFWTHKVSDKRKYFSKRSLQYFFVPFAP